MARGEAGKVSALTHSLTPSSLSFRLIEPFCGYYSCSPALCHTSYPSHITPAHVIGRSYDASLQIWTRELIPKMTWHYNAGWELGTDIEQKGKRCMKITKPVLNSHHWLGLNEAAAAAFKMSSIVKWPSSIIIIHSSSSKLSNHLN